MFDEQKTFEVKMIDKELPLSIDSFTLTESANIITLENYDIDKNLNFDLASKRLIWNHSNSIHFSEIQYIGLLSSTIFQTRFGLSILCKTKNDLITVMTYVCPKDYNIEQFKIFSGDFLNIIGFRTQIPVKMIQK